MRVAVIFFGIARGTRTTIDSVRRNIYDCNVKRGVSFYTVASLNLVDQVDNPRNLESGVVLDPGEAFALRADAYLLLRQNDTHIDKAMADAQRRGDLYDNGWISIRNSLHQLESLRRAWVLCRDLPERNFDYFLFVRPDLLYLDEIDLPALARGFRSQGSIALPSWHSYGGFNDRFAFADPVAARHYAERIKWVGDFCVSNPMHPESFLAYALRKGHCRVGALPARAQRVRSNGMVRDEGFDKSKIDLPASPEPFSFVGRVRYHSRIMRMLQVPYLLDMLRFLKRLRFQMLAHSIR